MRNDKTPDHLDAGALIATCLLVAAIAGIAMLMTQPFSGGVGGDYPSLPAATRSLVLLPQPRS